jgi:hypothetical protein
MVAKGYRGVDPYPSRYDLTPAFPDLTRDEIFAEIPIFNQSPAFYHLEYCDGALEGIHGLRGLYPEARTVILTAVGDDAATRAGRRKNLENVPFDALVMVPLHVSKRPWLEKIERPAIIVEDHAVHASTAAELGFTSILLDWPWNRPDATTSDGKPITIHPNVVRARTWEDVVTIAANRSPVEHAA